MEKHARLQTAAKTTAPWLLEGVFIVRSGAPGFAATQFGERRANRRSSRSAH